MDKQDIIKVIFLKLVRNVFIFVLRNKFDKIKDRYFFNQSNCM